MANVTTHVMLETVQAAATQIISRRQLNELGFERYIQTRLPMDCENIVLSMVSLFAADNMRKFVFTRPLDWWEAVKERFAPSWFLARYPVRYHTDTVDMKAIWAGYRPATDKYGPFLPYVLQRSFDDSKEMD